MTSINGSVSSSSFRGHKTSFKCKRLESASQMSAHTYRLKSLVGALPYLQFRELQDWMEATCFKLDVVGKLPLELSHVITQYLPLREIFAAQRVSHQWSRIFTSFQTLQNLQPLMQHWYGDNVTTWGQTLHVPDGLSSTAKTALMAEHMEAYRTGKAFSYRTREWNVQSPEFAAMSVAYADGVLAWIDSDAGKFHAFHIESGLERSFGPIINQDIPTYIAVSASVIAVTTVSDECYVWNLAGTEVYFLPYLNDIVAFAVFDNTVAIVHGLKWSDWSAQLTIWNSKDQKSRSTTLSWNRLMPSDCLIAFSYDGKTIVFFGFELTLSQYFIYFNCIGIDGKFVKEGRLAVPISPDVCIIPNSSVSCTSVLRDGCTVIWVLDEYGKAASVATLDYIRILYDSRQGELRLTETRIARTQTIPAAMGSSFYWKGVVYFLNDDENSTMLHILDVKEGTCREAEMSIVAERMIQDGEALDRHFIDTSSEILGDEKFLIQLSDQHFRIWCFDKNLKMAGEDMEYKEMMHEAKGKRRLLRENKI